MPGDLPVIELAQTTVSQRPTINQVARDLAGAVSQLLHLAGSGVLLIRDGRLFVAA